MSTGRYEGHTAFWHGVLWVVSRTGDPRWMQVLAVVLSAAVACRLLQDKPFPTVWCLLILFGYFVFYEYTIIPRPYIIALFLTSLLGSLIHRGGSSVPLLGMLCGLIAFTSAFGAVISLPLVIMLALDARQPGSQFRGTTLQWFVGLLLYGALLLWAVALIVFPFASNAFEANLIAGGRIQLASLPQAYIGAAFPHVDRLPAGVGSWITHSTSGRWLTILAACAVVVAVAVYLARYPAAVLAWGVAAIVFPLAQVYSGSSADRHMGNLFLLALSLCWARAGLVAMTPARSHTATAQDQSLSTAPLTGKWIARASHLCLLCVLSYHLLLGWAAASFDVRYAQSPWEQIARFVRDTVEEPYTLLIDNAYIGGAVTAYLDREPFDMHCPCRRRYTRWNEFAGLPAPQDILPYVCARTLTDTRPLVLITRADWHPDEHFVLHGSFAPGYREPGQPEARLFTLAPGITLSAACAIVTH